MYHTMIDPRCFSDIDGKYVGADRQVHQSSAFTYRTIFSGWDVFRSQFPLQTIINPTLVNDEINSLVQMAELSGKKYYPRWEFLNAYSDWCVGQLLHSEKRFQEAERYLLKSQSYRPNEPNHHAPFLLNYTSQPWLTQYWTRRICRNAYDNTVNGLCGNEDVGQMSAWYILATIGMHPICPGDNRYELTSPVFDKAIIPLDRQYHKGKQFTMIARNNSEENVYIQSVTLNGKRLNRLWITHQEITQGGVLEFVMGNVPNKKLVRGTK